MTVDQKVQLLHMLHTPPLTVCAVEIMILYAKPIWFPKKEEFKQWQTFFLFIYALFYRDRQRQTEQPMQVS